MNETADIKSILIALGDADESRVLLESAVQLANSLQASLEGLFIEDVELIDLAGLPFTREIIPGARSTRSLSSSMMERTLKSQREQVQQMFIKVSSQRHMQCHFSSVRGGVVDEVLIASEKNDLLLVSPRSRFVGKLVTRDQKIAVVCTDAGRIKKMLDIAGGLAQKNNQHELLILLPEAGTDELQAQIDSYIHMEKIKTEFVLLADTSIVNIQHILDVAGTRMLVLDTESVSLDDNVLRKMLVQCHCPVVLVK